MPTHCPSDPKGHALKSVEQIQKEAMGPEVKEPPKAGPKEEPKRKVTKKTTRRR